MAARAPGASSANSGHEASQALTSERRATGTTTPIVPPTRPAMSAPPRGSPSRGQRRRGPRAAPHRSTGRRWAGRRRGRSDRRTPRRTRRSPRSCGSWWTGGTRAAPSPSRAVARAAAASSGTGHEDCAGSPTIVQEAVRPRRPTIRHCIGVRSCASSTSTCAKRVVLDAVGGRRPAAAARAVLALHRRRQLLHVAAEEVVQLVVLLRARRHVAQRVAELVEQGHVLDRGSGLAGPGLREQPLILGGEHAVGHAGQEVGVAQPPEHGRRVQRRPPVQREVDEGLGGQHLVVERVAAALAAALATHLPPHQVEQRGGDARQLPVAPPLSHQLAAEPAELTGVEHDHVVAPEDPVVPW